MSTEDKGLNEMDVAIRASVMRDVPVIPPKATPPAAKPSTTVGELPFIDDHIGRLARKIGGAHYSDL